MNESFLHYVWKFRLFNTAALVTQSGESLTIINTGIHNFNGGPDFMHAHLRIGETEWVGHVEIHLKASDWHQHRHTNDIHYKNVILHAVYESDHEIFLHQPGDLQVMDIRRFMRIDQWTSYEGWLKSKTWIACQDHISLVGSLTWTSWKDRLLIERLEKKSTEVWVRLEKTSGDWSETFYRMLARNFGFKVNSDAMEMLAESLPQAILARHKSDPFQVEALLFGQAGMLNEIFADSYALELRKEYLFLQSKYSLKTLSSACWNFGRLRPANFPTIRIAQFATLISKSEHLFSRLLETGDIKGIRELFEVEANDYWSTHFRFDALTPSSTKEDAAVRKKIGEASLENILINSVATMLFSWGRYRSDQAMIDRSLALIESCRPESNKITDGWKRLDISSNNSGDSQALIELYNAYCTRKKCLQCMIGHQLLKK